VLIAIDFDGTVVDATRPYDDVTSPLVFLPGAREGLLSLVRAGHVLLLYSARSNRALRFNPELDPLVQAGVRVVDELAWRAAQPVHEARYRQMCAFVAHELPGVFAAVDDGTQGKPMADLFIDDRAVGASSWASIAAMLGE
jgi:hypothetical protein